MTTRRQVSWFLTEKGRRFSFAVITGTGIAFTAARFGPHTFFIDKYKDFVRYYNNGKPVELPAEISKRCEQCLDLLNLSDVHRKLVSPFSVYGYDLFHAGSTGSKFGVAVGVPVNFTYKSLDDIKKHEIQVNLQKVDWESDTGKKLADALILPEKVQQFAICREILMTQNNKIIFESVFPFASVFFVYNMAQYLNQRLNLFAAPAMVRVTMYTLTGMFGLGSYFLMKDMTQVYYESKVDNRLCELGQDFIESGVIFYDKLLKRNQALRELMGSEGEKKYSKLGNENFTLRQPRIALAHRKQFFNEKLKATSSDSDSNLLEESFT